MWQTYIFIYKPCPSTVFVVRADKYYEAVLKMEQILGAPHKMWKGAYKVLQNGTKMQNVA